jgi:hypothetical protein
MILTCDVTSVETEATSHGTAQTPSMAIRGRLLGKHCSLFWYFYVFLGLSIAYSVFISLIRVVMKFT